MSSLATGAARSEPAVVACPVTAVTLLEDRAELERTADLAPFATPGTHRLRLGPVTPLAVDRSLRAFLDNNSDGPSDGVEVIDVRLVRLHTPPPEGAPGTDASELRHRVYELTQRVRRLEADRSRAQARVAVLEQLIAELLRDIAESAGAGEAEPDRWTADLDRTHAEHSRQTEARRLVLRELRRSGEELVLAEAALGRAEERPPVLSAFVDVVLEVGERPPTAGLRLRLRHLVGCALWRPAYRAELAADGSSLSLRCDAVAWQRTGEDWDGVRLSLSTARTTLPAEPPRLDEDVLTLVDRTPEERRTIEVDLREVEIQTTGPVDDGPGFGTGPGASPGGDGSGTGAAEGSAPAPVLPGVDDGGEARLLVAPAPVTVPGDGRPHRVRLASAVLPARSGYRSVPELSALVTQVVRFRNDTGQVLLSGPVDLVRGSGFVGRGELGFTAQGATAELSFGSEDTFRVTRSVEESRDTTALTGRTVITRTVRLSLSRFAPPDASALAVVVRERIPVSEIAAVEVHLDKDRCAPPPDTVDGEGVVHYELVLGPDERRTLTLGYGITASRAVAV